MLRTEILNRLALARGYRRYLEIGVQDPRQNFNEIVCADRTGVDPMVVGMRHAADVILQMASDDFFTMLQAEPPATGKFDLIFIDGDHREPQVFRDVVNALDWLTPDGTIVMHDINPPTERHAAEEDHGGEWNGTAWRAFAKLRVSRPDLLMFTVDTDWGVGIVQRRGAMVWALPQHAVLLPPNDLATANHLLPFGVLEPSHALNVTPRQRLLGLVTPAEFLGALAKIGGA